MTAFFITKTNCKICKEIKPHSEHYTIFDGDLPKNISKLKYCEGAKCNGSYLRKCPKCGTYYEFFISESGNPVEAISYLEINRISNEDAIKLIKSKLKDENYLKADKEKLLKELKLLKKVKKWQCQN